VRRIRGDFEVTAPLSTELHEYGDSGLLVSVRGGTSETRWRYTHQLAHVLRLASVVGVVDVIGTYEDVFVAFDPVNTDHRVLNAVVLGLVRDLGDEVPPGAGGRVLQIPVLYGQEDGADLDDVAAELGLTSEQLVREHTARAWTVRFVASPTGAPFMDRPETSAGGWNHAVPRMASPRIEVPSGAVGLSGQQCMIYPHRSPGGWRLIGRTPLRLVDPTSRQLVPYGPGDSMRFVAIDSSRFAELAGTRPTGIDIS
jgi:KipI family sensor histidine kinase inhibitor